MTGPVELPSVTAPPKALEAIAQLVSDRGPVMFYLSGGCCEGTCPMCFERGEFKLGEHDVLLGFVGGCPVYLDPRQASAWGATTIELDVAPGEPEGFSLAAGPGSHFVIRSPQPHPSTR